MNSTFVARSSATEPLAVVNVPIATMSARVQLQFPMKLSTIDKVKTAKKEEARILPQSFMSFRAQIRRPFLVCVIS
jgi:hypothetical protein